jgi:hypothetical protein
MAALSPSAAPLPRAGALQRARHELQGPSRLFPSRQPDPS